MAEAAALLFDLDGTLVDTSEANFRAYRDALGEVGVTIERERFERVAFGRNWRQFLPQFLEQAGSEADPANVAARKRALYGNHRNAFRYNEQLLALAAAAHPNQRVALVTAASADSIDVVLGPARRKLFEVEVTGDDVARHKPAPDAYLLAARRLGVAPASCVAFEDSDIGAASATAAGMTVVRVKI
jgi:beta-phosphoglucomutase